MALNAPDYYEGSPDVVRGAQNLFIWSGWIRRRCNEITSEGDLELLKIYDLARLCKIFVDETDRWLDAGNITQVLETITDLTRQATNTTKTPADINTDYKDLYQACSGFISWASTNFPGSGETVQQISTVLINNNVGEEYRCRVSIPKAASVTTQVNALLAVYA